MLFRSCIVALPIFLAIDALWLGFIARGFYASQMGTMLRSPVLPIPALFAYLLLVLGLSVFVIVPAVEKKAVLHAIVYGALLGGVVYGVYDCTNMATLQRWSINLLIVDILWGVVVSSLVSALTTLLLLRLS
jgi:uncharacterized membrane protein